MEFFTAKSCFTKPRSQTKSGKVEIDWLSIANVIVLGGIMVVMIGLVIFVVMTGSTFPS